MPTQNALLNTRVYVDGYNFYYGCLKRTPYKWLDLLSLFERQILPSVMLPLDKESSHSYKMLLDEQCAIKFFTAKILSTVAKSDDSVSTQQKYHAALKAHSVNKLEIIEGYYSLNKMTVKLVDKFNPALKPKYCKEEAKAWKLEEKQSDVRLALHAYHDAISGSVDQVVIVSNDTDIAPAMEMIRVHTKVKVGLVTPTTNHERVPNQELADLAHWVRRHITESELKSSQLPRVILGRKPIVKPDSWYSRPDLLEKAVELLTPVRGSRSKSFLWLQKPNSALNGIEPIDLLNSDLEAKQVFECIETLLVNSKEENF